MFCIYEVSVLTATILVFISFNFNPPYDIIYYINYYIVWRIFLCMKQVLLLLIGASGNDDRRD